MIRSPFALATLLLTAPSTTLAFQKNFPVHLFGIAHSNPALFSYLDDISSTPPSSGAGPKKKQRRAPGTRTASTGPSGYLDGLPGKTFESPVSAVSEEPLPVAELVAAEPVITEPEHLEPIPEPVVETQPEPVVAAVVEPAVAASVLETAPEVVVAAPVKVASTKKAPPKAFTKRDRQAREPSASIGGALVPVNDATVEFTAGIIGGVAGFALAGPAGAATVAALANYLSKQDDDLSTVIQSFSKTALEISNYLIKLESKLDLTYKAKVTLEDTLDQLKEKDGINGEAIDKIEKAINNTVTSISVMSDEYDLWGEATSALGFVGELVEKSADKVVSVNQEYGILDRIWRLLVDAVSTAKVAVSEATNEAVAEEAATLPKSEGETLE